MSMIGCQRVDRDDLRQRSLRFRERSIRPVTFAFVDTYEGEATDPISLSKYLYANGNPIAEADPSGHMALAQIGVTVGIIATIFGGYFGLTYLSGRYIHNYGINKVTTSPKNIAIVTGDLGSLFTLSMAGGDFLAVNGFIADAKKSGHRVTVQDKPNEQQLIQLLNNNDLVLVLSHGPNDLYDGNKKPFAGMFLGGTSSMDVDDARQAWVTANELNGKVNNPNLVFVVPGCNMGKTSRFVDTVHPKYFVGSKSQTNSANIKLAFDYVAKWLNGDDQQQLNQWWQQASGNNVVNPTNKDFETPPR
jgi:hypothetical protein